MKEETLKNDLALTTGDSLRLYGDMVIVKLDKLGDHTVTASGLLIPANKLVETDGGKIRTETSSKKTIPSGTVLGLSAYADKKLQEMNGESLNVGDKVYVTSHANNEQYQFLIDRKKLVTNFEGVVAIPHIMIQGKIQTNG